MTEKISSFQNPRVKLIKRLRDKRGRERESRFVIDDLRDFERAVDCGFDLDYAFICPELADDAKELSRAERRIPVQKRFEVSREMMEKVNYRTHPGVMLGVMHTPSVSNFEKEAAHLASPILGLVGLQKPGNIGALLRTADAAGFKTICLIDTPLDLFNPNIIRSSTGAVFLPNIYQITGTQAATFFEQQNYQVVATHLEGQESLFAVHFADHCVILLGTEDVGLDDTWVERCDVLLKIPMMGELSDSLNVSVSGAVIMYEVLRQRMMQ